MKALRRLLMRFLEPELEEMCQTQKAIGYALGLAQGELRGRLQLADELEAIHAVDGGNKEIGLEGARRIKLRQLH
jgi:hypothetical protein